VPYTVYLCAFFMAKRTAKSSCNFGRVNETFETRSSIEYCDIRQKIDRLMMGEIFDACCISTTHISTQKRLTVVVIKNIFVR
jgi:hypothetical protein